MQSGDRVDDFFFDLLFLENKYDTYAYIACCTHLGGKILLNYDFKQNSKNNFNVISKNFILKYLKYFFSFFIFLKINYK